MLNSTKNNKSDILLHGLSLEINRIEEEKFFLSFKVVGTLTHEDYVQMIPLLEKTLKELSEPKLFALIDISELVGWEARAAWDDFKLGLKYNLNFKKVAIYGEHKLVDFGMKVASWFMNGEIEKFEHKVEALEWLKD